MLMVMLTQILGTGMSQQAPIWLNPAHVMTIQPRAPRDGYGTPQTGSIVQMVSGWLFTCSEELEDVADLLVGGDR